MRVTDAELIERRDCDQAVRAARGGPAMDWWDWEAELGRDLVWRELLIAENDGRPIGFVSCAVPGRFQPTVESG